MKNDPLILNIETATTVCSVALSRGSAILSSEQLDAGYTHAENLHIFIEKVLRNAGCGAGDLHAIALSSGPGSYTGLRIGSSTAKGLCFALDIPLITVGTLAVIAAAVDRTPGAKHICPMIDAGRMEVYTCVFDRDGREVLPVQALVIDEQATSLFEDLSPIHFVGQGMEKARHLLEKVSGSSFSMDIRPDARRLARLSSEAYLSGQFTQVNDFEPFYLKNFVAKKAKG